MTADGAPAASDSVRIRYENTLADAVAFNEFHLRASPHMQRSIRWNTWALPTAALCVAVVVAIRRESVEWLVWGALFGFLYVLIYRWLNARVIRRTIHALVNEGRNDTVLCEHELVVGAEGLVERTAVSESKTAWSAIHRVESSEGYTYIYTQANAAHIVPRDRLIEGDDETFRAALQGHVGSRRRGEESA